MDGLFRLTIIGTIVYTIILVCLAIGHYQELKTGETESLMTKIGMVIGILSIFVPVTGLPVLLHTLLLFTPEESVRGGIGILSIPISFGLLILALMIAFLTSDFLYTTVLRRTPHEKID